MLMEFQVYDLIKDLSEEDVIDVLHEFSVDLEEDGYDSYDILNQIIIETKLYEFIDCEFVLSEAVNPRARRILVRNKRASNERMEKIKAKKKGRFGRFLSRIGRFLTGKRSSDDQESKPKRPVRGIDYHYDFPVTASRSRTRTRSRSSDSRPTESPSGGSSGSRATYTSGPTSSRAPSSRQEPSTRSTRQSEPSSQRRRREPSPTTARLSRPTAVTTKKGIIAGKKQRISDLHARRAQRRIDAENQQKQERSQANIRAAAERMRANPLARTGSSGSSLSGAARERLSQAGITQTPDSPGYKSKKGGTKKETKDAAVARAQAAGLSSRHIERIKSRFDQQAQQQRDQRAAQRSQRQAQRSQKEAEAQKAARIRRAGQRPFRGTRPVQSNLSQRRQEVEARRTAKYNQANRILSPEAQQRAMSSGVSPEKVGLSMKPDFSKTSKSGKPLKPYSPKGEEGTQRIMRARRLSGEAGLQRSPETRQERQSRPREFSEKNRQQVTEMLLDLGYAPDYYSAIAILENLSDNFYNYLIEEYTYDSQY